MRKVILLGLPRPELIDALQKALKDEQVEIIDGGDIIDCASRTVPQHDIAPMLKSEDPQADQRLERHRQKQEHRHERKQFEQLMRAKTRRFK
jgi:hypothetical protein